jgi:phosphoribosylformylglycinamidine synthase subunit PurS
MKFSASITIMPLKALLDPQGKAVSHSMKNLNLSEIDNVRIGKHITLEVDAPSKTEAAQKVETACKKLLANPIMESFDFVLKELEN